MRFNFALSQPIQFLSVDLLRVIDFSLRCSDFILTTDGSSHTINNLAIDAFLGISFTLCLQRMEPENATKWHVFAPCVMSSNLFSLMMLFSKRKHIYLSNFLV